MARGAARSADRRAGAAWPSARWSADEALVEILRGRLEGLGPVAEAALAAPLGLAPGDIAGALAALQEEGFALRGRFTPGAADDEWCERRLLARIHRYTLKRLRAEIEPVAARDFLRFLFDWQRVTDDDPHGRAGRARRGARPARRVRGAGRRLGDRDPAGARRRVRSGLARRPVPRRPHRLGPAAAAHTAGERRQRRARPEPGPPGRCARRRSPCWRAGTRRSGPRCRRLPDPAQASPRGRAVADFIRDNGASFFDELVDGTRLLRPQIEEALAELVALGLVSSDSFAGLRALLMPADKRRSAPAAGRCSAWRIPAAGRWRAAPARARPSEQADEAVEHLARTLLRRYGVVFWRLLEREAAWLPPWRDLLRVYRRLEARGEIRGGRFVAGFSGEQFALPEAVGMLREIRRKPGAGDLRVAVRRRPAEPRRHPDPRPEARGR